MRCPDTAAFRLSPPLAARPLMRLTIRSGKSHPGFQTQPQRVRNVWKAVALARSDHPAAMGESEPSVTLPRTPIPAIVWYQQKQPIIQRYPAIDATDSSVSRAWVHIGQPAPKTSLKASHKVHYRPEECTWGRTVPDRDSAVWSRFVTVRHATSQFAVQTIE